MGVYYGVILVLSMALLGISAVVVIVGQVAFFKAFRSGRLDREIPLVWTWLAYLLVPMIGVVSSWWAVEVAIERNNLIASPSLLFVAVLALWVFSDSVKRVFRYEMSSSGSP